MNCREALAFDPYTIEGKDGFQSMGLTESIDVTGEESSIST